jgi:hypothetical protein
VRRNPSGRKVDLRRVQRVGHRRRDAVELEEALLSRFARLQSSAGSCCGGVCTFLDSDSQNWGGCGVKCCPGSTCSPEGLGSVGVCL